jgi:hypothetical protein
MVVAYLHHNMGSLAACQSFLGGGKERSNKYFTMFHRLPLGYVNSPLACLTVIAKTRPCGTSPHLVVVPI